MKLGIDVLKNKKLKNLFTQRILYTMWKDVTHKENLEQSQNHFKGHP